MHDSLPSNDIGLSLCMIVRDSARTLAPCLASIQPWVDELVVVDTGSKDNTREIAAGYGARVFEFPWCDDFAAARNESIRHARGRWLFWMDSDDTINEINGRRLRALAQSAHKSEIFGYVMQVHCPGGRLGDDVTVVDHIKLFRNLKRLRFEFRIHEQLLPAIRRLGGEVEWTDIHVVHSGSDHSAEGQRKKQQRDLRLLELELRDRPGHPFALFNMGMTLADVGQNEGAVDYLRRSLAASGKNDSHLRKAYAILIGALLQLGRLQEALTACSEGLALCPHDPELLFRQGMTAHMTGDHTLAEAAFLAAMHPLSERFFSSRDTGITGFKARHNLALVYLDMKRLDLAEIQWREAIAAMPNKREAWTALGNCLIDQKKLASAKILGECLKPGSNGLRSVGHLILAATYQAEGNVYGASEAYEDAARQFGDDPDVLREAARFHFEGGHPDKALPYQQALAVLTPDDAAAHHNLGSLWLVLGNPRLATESFVRSLELRPDAPETRRQLNSAMGSKQVC